MKKLRLLICLLLGSSLGAVSCLDDDSGNTPIYNIVPPSSSEFASLSSNYLTNNTQIFTFDTSETMVFNFTSEKGVEVTIYGDCLTINDTPLEGEIEIKYIELFDKSSLLKSRIATMGKHEDGSLEMLVSGGAFYINVYQNGDPVDLTNFCNYTIIVPTSLTGGVDYDMSLWYGSFDENSNLIWEPAEVGEQGGGIEMLNDAYYVYASQFGWTNIDRFYNDPREKTTLRVKAPNGYNLSNCAIFLSYDGEDNGLARLDFFENGLFTEHYGQIPIGLECHVIFVSRFNNDWVYAIKPVTIAENEVIEIESEELTTITEQQLTGLINGLP